MTYSDNWCRFREAEAEYFTCRYNLMQDKEALAKDLEMALQSADNRLTALGLLAEATPEFALIAPLIPSLVDAAVDSSLLTVISLAREVLHHHRSEPQVRGSVVALSDGYLADNDEWHFRRFAELYQFLGYKPELDSLLLRCKASSYAGIREIGEDYAV